jgi:putative ABC transport system substrate-binding protein
MLAGIGVLAGCIPAPGVARPTRPHRVGYLAPGTASTSNVALFRDGLRSLGYEEGRTIVIDVRYAEGREDQLRANAAELVALHPDVIVTSGKSGIMAARQATSTIPIVFATSGDPVAEGFVASLARPGGNITGLTVLAGNEHGKRLALLKETVPTLSRIGILSSQSDMLALRQVENVAPTLGVQVVPLLLERLDDLETLLVGALGHIDGLLQAGTTLVISAIPLIVNFAARNHLPSIYEANNAARIGGLMVYAPRNSDNFRRAATYVDKILRGAKPADLPIEQPTTIDFVINLKTAQDLGLTVPPSVLQQATEVIR